MNQTATDETRLRRLDWVGLSLTLAAALALVTLRAPVDPVATAVAGGVACTSLFAMAYAWRHGRNALIFRLVILSWVALLLQSLAYRGALVNGLMPLAAVPLVMALMQGMEAGLRWLVGMLVLTGVTTGLALWFGLPTDPLTGSASVAADGVISAVFVGVVGLIGLAFERGRLLAMREVAEAERQQARAEAEAQLMRTQQMASLGQLAAGAAHEINNPLSYVIGNLEMMEAGVEGALAEAARDALLGARQIERVVRDLKTYAREDDEHLGSVVVSDEVSLVCKMIAAQVRHHAQLVQEVDGSLYVRGNPGRVRQVLLNLLINGSQAIDPGAPEAHRLSVRACSEGEQVTLEVRDTGRGIPAELQQKVFEPFFTTKPVGVGTGLGLSVCRNLVERMGGSLELSSQLGVGTTVTVRLPSCGPPTMERTTEVEQAAPPRLHVLVIDDDALVARSLSRLLAAHDVEVVLGGERGLAALRMSTYDLVLCDLMMPDLDGMDLYTKIIGEDAAIADRFWFMTGGAFTARARAFRDRDPRRFLDKPVDRAALEKVVRRAVRRAAPAPV